MLWIVIGLLLLLWVVGFVTGFLGSAIHLLLFIAAIVLLIQLFFARGPAGR